MNGLPTVRIDDILIHPRDNDLILGTHGRSIYILDDITALQQMTDESRRPTRTLFDIRPAIAWATDIQKAIPSRGRRSSAARTRRAGSAISYWLKSARDG